MKRILIVVLGVAIATVGGAAVKSNSQKIGAGVDASAVADTVTDAEPTQSTLALVPAGSTPGAAAEPATTVPAAPATAPAITAIPAHSGVTMAFSGDILIHSQLWQRATVNNGGSGYDFDPMFAAVKPIVNSVDFAICHLEVPVAPPGKAPSTFPLYGAPVEIVASVAKAGYDHCSTASNHTLDQGTAGIDATVNAFDANGITESGMARTPKEIEPRVLEANGIKFTHLSYTFGFNGLSLPSGQPWRSAEINPTRIIADAKKARSLGAQLVIVSMHWGTETVAAVSSYQRKAAEAITASGQVDLVIGHHAHVLQKIEKVNGVWTVFGLGNLLSFHPTRAAFPPSSQDGMIVTVKLGLDAGGKAVVDQPVVYPTWVDKSNGIVIRPVLADLADPNVSAAKKAQLQVSLDRTASVLGDFIAK